MVRLDVLSPWAIFSEAGIVPWLFLIFGDFEPRCSYKIVLIKKECSLKLCHLLKLQVNSVFSGGDWPWYGKNRNNDNYLIFLLEIFISSQNAFGISIPVRILPAALANPEQTDRQTNSIINTRKIRNVKDRTIIIITIYNITIIIIINTQNFFLLHVPRCLTFPFDGSYNNTTCLV